jgi:hypothetical protein
MLIKLTGHRAGKTAHTTGLNKTILRRCAHDGGYSESIAHQAADFVALTAMSKADAGIHTMIHYPIPPIYSRHILSLAIERDAFRLQKRFIARC